MTRIAADISRPATSPHRPAAPTRRGFTLVEMLVVIAIIGMIAAMALAALYQSQQSARAARTRAIITRLHQAMATRWESYRTRRLPSTVSAPNTPGINTRIFLVTQLRLRRQMMRIELPDRWADVAWDQAPFNYASNPAVPPYNFVSAVQDPKHRTLVSETMGTPFNPPVWPNLIDLKLPDLVPSATTPSNRTALASSYFRRYQQIVSQHGSPPTEQHQGAECLYMILTSSMGDDSSSDMLISKHDIGDVDNDGAPEFLDGWGKPIQFLRWAPGFYSDLQPGIPNAADPFTGHDATANHDPFDPMKVDPLAFELFPLIYSAGPDGVAGLESGDPTDLNDPYSSTSASTWHGQPVSTAFDGGGSAGDNIHNHLLDIRK